MPFHCKNRKHVHSEGEKGSFTLEGAKKHYSPSLGLEPIHLEIEFQVDPVKHILKGRVGTTILCNNSEQRSFPFLGLKK